MEHFLKSHPQLPKINLSTPFNFQKTFYRSDGVQRMWLTYNSNSKRCGYTPDHSREYSRRPTMVGLIVDTRPYCYEMRGDLYLNL